jgi:hypothetical protein
MDFDILYMMKTPLFLGNPGQVAQEALQVEIHSEDLENNNQKQLLLLRAMCAGCDVNGLKEQMKNMME